MEEREIVPWAIIQYLESENEATITSWVSWRSVKDAREAEISAQFNL